MADENLTQFNELFRKRNSIAPEDTVSTERLERNLQALAVQVNKHGNDFLRFFREILSNQDQALFEKPHDIIVPQSLLNTLDLSQELRLKIVYGEMLQPPSLLDIPFKVYFLIDNQPLVLEFRIETQELGTDNKPTITVYPIVDGISLSVFFTIESGVWKMTSQKQTQSILESSRKAFPEILRRMKLTDRKFATIPWQLEESYAFATEMFGNLPPVSDEHFVAENKRTAILPVEDVVSWSRFVMSLPQKFVSAYHTDVRRQYTCSVRQIDEDPLKTVVEFRNPDKKIVQTYFPVQVLSEEGGVLGYSTANIMNNNIHASGQYDFFSHFKMT